ncbi:hypothetical protein E2C01_082796 [Portunus trituberculatus]|uniref:Uncharacterized protein n=1 Tax=Portunus trituberculatus TaxID=210409 RepID=A0A5B7J1S4_PORTR|nr:hypothetical protein [Portunus trituberculatus]
MNSRIRRKRTRVASVDRPRLDLGINEVVDTCGLSEHHHHCSLESEYRQRNNMNTRSKKVNQSETVPEMYT